MPGAQPQAIRHPARRACGARNRCRHLKESRTRPPQNRRPGRRAARIVHADKERSIRPKVRVGGAYWWTSEAPPWRRRRPTTTVACPRRPGGRDGLTPGSMTTGWANTSSKRTLAVRVRPSRPLAIYPPLRDLVRENRAFVTQAVTSAARPGDRPVHRPGRRAPPPQPSARPHSRAVVEVKVQRSCGLRTH